MKNKREKALRARWRRCGDCPTALDSAVLRHGARWRLNPSANSAPLFQQCASLLIFLMNLLSHVRNYCHLSVLMPYTKHHQNSPYELFLAMNTEAHCIQTIDVGAREQHDAIAQKSGERKADWRESGVGEAVAEAKPVTPVGSQCRNTRPLPKMARTGRARPVSTSVLRRTRARCDSTP